MQKILTSLLMIAVVSGGVVGSTSAFFTDTETSTNNLLQAGAIDLQIGNTSYYNGDPVVGSTWEIGDLTDELFFNLNDVKPADYGESTIDLKVLDNDAWACMSTSITDNSDGTCTDPELTDDPTCSLSNPGELSTAVNMILWADDGDNVLESNETVIASGAASTVLNQSIDLADSNTNYFGAVGTPLTGAATYHVGQGWCMGTLAQTPVAQATPGSNAGNPTVNAGFTCDGSAVNNAPQTDILKANISFTTVQHRNNESYTCGS